MKFVNPLCINLFACGSTWSCFVRQVPLPRNEVIQHKKERMTATKEVRVRNTPLKVYVTPTEREHIETLAKRTHKTSSALLRDLAMGFEPRSSFDRDAIEALIRLHADQGRLGGLLKLWLSGEQRAQGASVSDVRSLLQQIESLQVQLAKIVMSERKRL